MQAIGIDLGGTNLRAALVEVENGSAKIAREQRQALGAKRDPKTVAGSIAALVEQLSPASRSVPIGIGIAGMLDATGRTVVNSPNLGWRDTPFGDLVEQTVGRPVILENDLSMITWGEHQFGAGKGFSNVVCVFVGTGVGAGSVLNNELYRGGSNASFEIGHVRVVPGGRQCGCGAKGCLEAYVGGAHLAEMACHKPSSTLTELVAGNLDDLHAGHLDEAARKGDSTAQQLITQAGAFLAGTLGDVTVLLNPDCLILGGTVWQNCAHLRDITVHVFSELDPAPARDHVKLVEADLPDSAGVMGAAALALAAAQA